MTDTDQPALAGRVEVTTAEGPVVGRRTDAVTVFRGIPFAAAPVGPLRFAAPEPPYARSEPLDASEYGPISVQDLDPLPFGVPPTQENFFFSEATTSEDCLTLNIWSPDTDGAAPVLLWIHGGAFMYGSGTGSWTDGTAHAQNSRVVVVSINYRLGLVGGLYLGDLQPGLANFGILDQIASLRWVKENIAAFGGDPDNITIAGQSAGAMSTAALLASPLAKGLFQHAIVESGHMSATTSIAEAIEARDTVVRQLGLDPADPRLLRKLREVSILRLMAVQRVNGLEVRTFPLVEDGISIVVDPIDAIRRGFADGVDLLIGINEEEDRLFALTGWTADESMPLRDDLSQVLTDGSDIERAMQLYRGGPGTEMDRRHRFATDHGWGAPNRELALAHAEAGNRVFHYVFAWRSTALDGRVGAAHLVELPFAFNNLQAPGTDALLGERVAEDATALAVSSGMASAGGAFIAQGTPNPSGLPDWPQYTDSDRNTMVIDGSPHAERDRDAERLDFWSSVEASRPLVTLGQHDD
jgi:para-nitrobenzyl esterase